LSAGREESSQRRNLKRLGTQRLGEHFVANRSIVCNRMFGKTVRAFLLSKPTHHTRSVSGGSRAFIETDEQIRASHLLTKLLREKKISDAITSTSDIATEIDYSKVTIEPINPKLVYREKMRNIRRLYLAEGNEIRKTEREQMELAIQQAIDERALFDADVEKRRKERALMETDITFDRNINTNIDPIVNARQAQWNTWLQEAKDTKQQNIKESLQAASERRLEHLVYLFQEAATYITLETIDERVGNTSNH